MTKRRNAKSGRSLETLVDQLPEDLRHFGTYTDLDKRRDDILRWINAQRQDGSALVRPVMDAVGLTFLSDFRDRLVASAHPFTTETVTVYPEEAIAAEPAVQ